MSDYPDIDRMLFNADNSENQDVLDTAVIEEETTNIPGVGISDTLAAKALIDFSDFDDGDDDENATYLDKEMEVSFLEYAMSVITARALPDARDGLKPVQRRILYGMYESGYTQNRPHMKSARTVGDVMGKYHPHGDSSIYDTLTHLAQPFAMRLPLIDGHGNFGSIDGDSAAAMRYTEARLDSASMELLRDLDKETVDFQPNYDESLQEPTVLPARFPNLLVNGSNGIAVGMATNIPPHNLGEAIDAACLVLENPDCTTDDILAIMPGPDFPTGGVIIDNGGIKDYFETGRGSFKNRGSIKIEAAEKGRENIIITEIPYQVNRLKLMEKLGQLVLTKKIPEIESIRDGADRKGIDIIIELRKGADARSVIKSLLKQTQLESNFSAIMLALDEAAPRILSVKDALVIYANHQKDVVTRRSAYDLEKAREREHILEGLIIALDDIDKVISIIRNSESDKQATNALKSEFSLSDKQCSAILDMRLRRLTGLERQKVEDELATIRENIAHLTAILSDPKLLAQTIREELQTIKETYATPRKTLITTNADALTEEDLTPDEECVVLVTANGCIGRVEPRIYKKLTSAKRATKDAICVAKHTTTRSTLYLVFENGEIATLKTHELALCTAIPETPLTTFVSCAQNSHCINAFVSDPSRPFVLFSTRSGLLKKTELTEYSDAGKCGIAALKLIDDDSVVRAQLVSDTDIIAIASNAARGYLTSASQVPATGRVAKGVNSINLGDGDVSLGAYVLADSNYLTVVTKNGCAKRIPIDECSLQNRRAKGYALAKLASGDEIIACLPVQANDTLSVFANGKASVTKAEDIAIHLRATACDDVFASPVLGAYVLRKESLPQSVAEDIVEAVAKDDAEEEKIELTPVQETLF